MFYFYLFEGGSFLIRDRNGMGPEGRVCGGELGGVEGRVNFNQDTLYDKRI